MTRDIDTTKENLWLGSLGKAIVAGTGIVGLLGLAASAWLAWSTGQQERFFLSYLVSFMYFLSLGLGALFLLLLGHLVRAGWSVVVRRINEWIVAGLPWLALLFIPILFGLNHLYPWMHPQTQADEHLRHLLDWKSPYLNLPFFCIRAVVYFAAWLIVAWYYLRQSMRQDRLRDLDASAAVTLRMERLAPAGLILFAVTLTFAAFDWLMSRDPYWYSTVYGVYYFAGCVVGAFSLLTTMIVLLQASGRMRQSVAPDHYQDLGKYTFGFCVFWAYIAFSQYLLIWYGNIPEETEWYQRRQTGAWATVSLALLFGHFFLPFFALISRAPKRVPGLLAAVCVWILILHWLDIYWLVMPETFPGHLSLNWLDLLTFLGIGGVFAAGATLWQRRQPLVPISDPRLGDSLMFENA